jgi:hypothetical protein
MSPLAQRARLVAQRRGNERLRAVEQQDRHVQGDDREEPKAPIAIPRSSASVSSATAPPANTSAMHGGRR